ncbi:amino acid starvation-responsive transcription factor GCN4 [Aspergillus affinis]|uniref:amino acid starvation-responsive transcription factor GCN4 n=1 Tax=Aspergillus affinis TaxID=1070780 RepID=UPI0022FE754D|nr:uncharacterized protein KD926_008267 [Aspergillus affinis]KAI9040444.1 hypothetical protein KD926_008267 [Aspergillus affinis]
MPGAPLGQTGPIRRPQRSATIHAQIDQDLAYQLLLQNGLLNPSNGKSPSFSSETDIIDPSRTSSSIFSPLHSSSESPVPGPLNFSSAPRSSSSPNTISSFDVTSFNTDNHQQSWLPTPPPPQPLAQISNSNVNNNSSSPQEDFVLYPPCPQPRPRDSSTPVLSSTTPRLAAYHPFLVRSGHLPQRQSFSLQQQQQQPQQPRQFASPPVQVPRVARLASQSTGFPQSLSHRSSPSSRKHLLRVHAASVASNSAPNSASLNRPPVPLFHSPTHLSYYQNQQSHPTHHRRMMSTPNMAHGKLALSLELASLLSSQTQTNSVDLPDLFDFTTDQFGADFDLSMLSSPQQIPTGIMASKEAMADAPPGTISPKDLLMDASAPSSTSFTDLSTPSFESPGYFSQDTSPMFATDMELAPGHEEWDSLFPTQDAFPALPFDSTTLDVAPAAVSEPQEQAEVPMPSPKTRSPSTASSPSSNPATKLSHVAGVNARSRKPLPPIKFDSCDPVAMKRARNTEAARKSRARKLERQDVMERRIAQLEKSLEEAEQREQYWKAMAQAQTQV